MNVTVSLMNKEKVSYGTKLNI